jgi:hypothetical protein
MDKKRTQIDAEAKFVCGDQRQMGDADIVVQRVRSNGELEVSIQISTEGAITSVSLDADETVELIDQLEDLVYDQAELLE